MPIKYCLLSIKQTLENTEEVMKIGQPREPDNTGYTRRRKTQQKHEPDNTGYTRRRKTQQTHNTICVGHHFIYPNKNK